MYLSSAELEQSFTSIALASAEIKSEMIHLLQQRSEKYNALQRSVHKRWQCARHMGRWNGADDEILRPGQRQSLSYGDMSRSIKIVLAGLESME